MITLYEYVLLDESQKADYLWDKGTYIHFRTDGEFRINLYRLHDFYVEVFINSTANKIEKLRSFGSESQLEPYLKYIDVAALINGGC